MPRHRGRSPPLPRCRGASGRVLGRQGAARPARQPLRAVQGVASARWRHGRQRPQVLVRPPSRARLLAPASTPRRARAPRSAAQRSSPLRSLMRFPALHRTTPARARPRTVPACACASDFLFLSAAGTRTCSSVLNATRTRKALSRHACSIAGTLRLERCAKQLTSFSPRWRPSPSSARAR